MKVKTFLLSVLTFMYLITTSAFAQKGEHIVIGIDDKVALTEKGLIKVAPTQDRVCFLNIAKQPAAPSLNCELILENSIFGPPTNLAITPNEQFAVIANSVNWEKNTEGWQAVPDVDIHLVDLTQSPVKVVDTLQVKKQPSGIAISRDGSKIAIAHRHGKAISLVGLKGNKLTLLDEVSFSSEISSVAFTANAERIYATQFSAHQVVMVDIKHNTLAVNEHVIPVGLWPYNIKLDPKGRYAIAANTGNKGLPDGQVDTLSIIDIQAKFPHVVNTVSVGDGPEGLAISPDGNYVAVALLQGSGKPFKDTFFYQEHGGLVIYQLNAEHEQLSLTEINRFEVGGFPEGVAFSKDATHLYLGNIVDKNIEIFSLIDNKFSKIANEITLPGQPVSMGSASP